MNTLHRRVSLQWSTNTVHLLYSPLKRARRGSRRVILICSPGTMLLIKRRTTRHSPLHHRRLISILKHREVRRGRVSTRFLPADRRNNINTESPVRRAARAVDRCPPWTTPWTPKHWNRSLRRLCPNRKESIRDQQQRERVRRFRRSTTTVIHRGIREISIRRKTTRLPRRVVRRKRVHPVRLPIMAIEHRKKLLTHHHPRPPRFPIPTVSPTITSLLEPRSSISPSRIPTRTQRTFLPITRVNIMDSILLTATARRFPPVLIHNGSNSITLRIKCVSSFVRSFAGGRFSRSVLASRDHHPFDR